MNRFWVIGNSKKGTFSRKIRFYFLIKLFLHTFFQKRTFCYSTTFFESLITHKRFVFKESYISYGKRQKSCTLIVILVKCLYLTSPIFNSLAKSNRTFYLPGRKYNLFSLASRYWHWPLKTYKTFCLKYIQIRAIANSAIFQNSLRITFHWSCWKVYYCEIHYIINYP